jgi:hypothetical protein
MSHRVTTETSMTDKDVILKVAKAQNIGVTESGQTLRFTSGPMRNATLDTKSGRISGDTDFGHTESGLGMLRQGYSEELYRRECLKQGIQIESRSVLSQHNGHKDVIKLIVAMG